MRGLVRSAGVCEGLAHVLFEQLFVSVEDGKRTEICKNDNGLDLPGSRQSTTQDTIVRIARISMVLKPCHAPSRHSSWPASWRPASS